MNSWIRQLVCWHPPAKRELVITGGSATIEEVTERCSECHKVFRKSIDN